MTALAKNAAWKGQQGSRRSIRARAPPNGGSCLFRLICILVAVLSPLSSFTHAHPLGLPFTPQGGLSALYPVSQRAFNRSSSTVTRPDLPIASPPPRTALVFMAAMGNEAQLAMLRLVLLSMRLQKGALEELEEREGRRLRPPTAVKLVVCTHAMQRELVESILKEALGDGDGGGDGEQEQWSSSRSRSRKLPSYPYEVVTVEASTIFEAASSKLMIPSVRDVQSYDVVLSLDTDMVLTAPIETILQLPITRGHAAAMGGDQPSSFHAIAEASFDVDHEFFSLGRYPAPWLQQARSSGRRPFNSGAFLFPPAPRLLDMLREVKALADADPEEARPVYGLEQPYLNHVLNLADAVDTELLEGLVVLDALMTEQDGQPLSRDPVLVHVTAQGIIAEKKISRMKALLLRQVAGVPPRELMN